MKESAHLLGSSSSHDLPRRSLQLEEIGSSPDEERKGLLPHAAEGFDEELPQIPQHAATRRWLLIWTVGLSFVMMLGVLFREPIRALVFPSPPCITTFDRDTIQSNGTHDFKRTALIVSIDGLRYAVAKSPYYSCLIARLSADYLDRGLTPHLLDISKKGIRAKSMKPIFPVRNTLLHLWKLLTLPDIRL